jgi:hypothetical protein
MTPGNRRRAGGGDDDDEGRREKKLALATVSECYVMRRYDDTMNAGGLI